MLKKLKALEKILYLFNINKDDTVEEVFKKIGEGDFVKKDACGTILAAKGLQFMYNEFKNGYIVVRAKDTKTLGEYVKAMSTVFPKERIVGILDECKIEEMGKIELMDLRNEIEKKLVELEK